MTDAFLDRLARHAAILRKVAATYAWTASDRHDLMQDITLQLWRAWPRYDPARPFSTWMYRIALNVAISALRARPPQPIALEPDHLLVADPTDHAEARERLALLQRFLHAQDPIARALLLLHLDDTPHREIADILGISETNVSTRIARLKQRFRRSLDPPRPSA